LKNYFLQHFINYRLLYKTADTTIVRSQDEISLIQSAMRIIRMRASNPVGTRLAFDYLEENWDTFVKRFG